MSAEPARELATSPSAPRVTRGTVHAGASTTDYLRAGCGAPVVLLGSAGPDPGERSLFAALAGGFRVIAPVLPPEPHAGPRDAAAPPFSAWLRGVLDGLGLAEASLVAEEAYALRALSFALTDPMRVSRVALLFRDAPDPALPGGAFPELLGLSGHPLLVSCQTEAAERGDACATARADVVRFLRGDAEPAPRD
jgi:pimeloyl-ACP methyl ester carboxylesterase